MFISKKKKKKKKISHGFFNRSGGKSKGIYKSLNCGLGSKDQKNKVRANLRIVKNKISKNSKNIFLLHQVHSNNFIFIDQKFRLNKKKIKADALITNQKNLPIAVLTADCVPVLLYEEKKNIIAAIHVGWKGAYKGIINKVIKFMIKKGCELENITAVVGPSISLKNYEIKRDFKRKFIKKDKKNYKFFKKKKSKLYFDLTNYVYNSLKKIKIKNIDVLNIDTFDIKNKFFSARRALKLKHNDYGRNISIIMLN